MSRRDRLINLIHMLYAAPGTYDGWTTFLNGMCDAMNASTAHFISVSHQRHYASVAMTVRIDPAALEAYSAHWGALDPWGLSPRLHEAAPGAVVVGEDLVSHRDFTRTEYYADFARHYDLVRSAIGIIDRARGVSVISIGGPERRGTFRSDECLFLEALMPHLQRAVQLHRRLVTAEGVSAGLGAAVDRSAHAVLLTDAGGCVTFMNCAAERLVGACDGLVVDEGELRAARPADTTRLRELIAAAASTSVGNGLNAGGTLVLGRPSGKASLRAVVSPVARRRRPFPGLAPAAAMIVVTDPEQTTVPDQETLRALFSLTTAEARLARLLAQSLTLDDAALRLGLRLATVRTRVKMIFEKTDTHRQAELVSLLTAAPRL